MIRYFKEKTVGHKVVLTLAVIALGLSVYLWHAVLLPQKELIGQLKEQCEIGKSRVAKVSAFAKERADYESYLKELDKKLGKLNTMLPVEIALSEFLQELERLAQNSGISVVNITPLAALEQENWQQLPIEMSVTGSFINFIEFTEKLEGSGRFLSISTMSVSFSNDKETDKATPELTGKFLMIIYSTKK